MKMVNVLIMSLETLICLSMFVLVQSDFLGTDFKSEMEEIDKMLKSLDNDDEELEHKFSPSRPNTANDLGDLLGGLNLLGDNVCKYNCKNGRTPKPRQGHVPSSNGCGSYGLQFEIADLPEVSRCCDQHDKCYDTCNSRRELCDDRFRKCLKDVCSSLKKSSKVNSQTCMTSADIMYSGAATLGCQSFLDAQKKACTCEPTSRADDKPNIPLSKKSKPHESKTAPRRKTDTRSRDKRKDEL